VLAELAAMLSIYPDAAQAARMVGLAVDGEQLDAMVQAAHEHHAGIIAGDPADMGRRVTAAINMMVTLCVRERAEIAPRDRPHVARALSQIHAVMVGDRTPRVSELSLVVVGADGQPIDVNAIEQPRAKDE
jgi:hypothetical protein